MKTYELTYIVSPDISSEEATNRGKEIESAIIEREGVVIKQSAPIAKALSYQIAKRASGYMGVIEFQLEPEKLIEIKDLICKNKEIIRHMLIIKEAVELKRQRRMRDSIKTPAEPSFTISHKKEKNSDSEIEKTPDVKISEIKGKVELKDIEHELDELLGE